MNEKKFLAFLNVQRSEKCNMRNVQEVIKVSSEINETELSEKDIKYILKNYPALRDHFGIGGYNVSYQPLK